MIRVTYDPHDERAQTMAQILLRELVGPFVIGGIIFYLIHVGTGAMAGFVLKDKKRFLAFQAAYLDFAFLLKDILALWAIGAILFLILGVI